MDRLPCFSLSGLSLMLCPPEEDGVTSGELVLSYSSACPFLLLVASFGHLVVFGRGPLCRTWSCDAFGWLTFGKVIFQPLCFVFTM